MGRLLRRLHRLHRALGSVLCVLMASWFLSGAVMTFAHFPYYGAAARRDDLMPLAALPQAPLSAALRDRLSAFMKQPGAELALTRPLPEPRLLLLRDGQSEAVLAWPSGEELAPLDEQESRRLAERVVGADVETTERLEESDQWSVPLPRSLFPLFRLALSDDERTELYVSQASAEIVQRTTRTTRLLAWFGAIPHWIYPTMLRRDRSLWRSVVIALAAFGMVLTAAGLSAGLDTAQRLKRRQRTRPGQPLNDATLRLHQRIGLGFGLLAFSWLFSGILSFNPLDWTNSRGLYARAQERLRGAPSATPAHALMRIPQALALCQSELAVRELRVRYVASHLLASCLGRLGEARVVALEADALQVASALSAALLTEASQAIAGSDVLFRAQRVDRADQYYYPTHTEPDVVVPYVRVSADDIAESTHYLDPHTGELLRTFSARTRLERFLYHGLHSWDFAFLYRERGLWRALVLLAMGFGASLSLLGVGLTARRILRRRKMRERLRARAHEARAALDASGQSLG